MPHRLPALLIAALATALIAAGCGGDDEETISADSGEDFVTQVTEACDAARADLDEVDSSIQDAITAGDAEQVTTIVQEDLVAVSNALIDDLETITPPEDQADTYEQYLANAQEGVDLAEESAEEFISAAGGEQNEVSQQIQGIETENDQLSDELGIPESCGEGAGGTTGEAGAEPSG